MSVPKTKYELVVEALAAGRPMDEVRAQYEPELHQRIMERKLRANDKTSILHKRGPAPAVWGFVYIFAAGDLVKVGMSDVGVKARWSSIKTANPLLEEQILYISPPLGNSARSVERAAHEALTEHRQTGEWFRCERQLAIDTVTRIVEMPR